VMLLSTVCFTLLHIIQSSDILDKLLSSISLLYRALFSINRITKEIKAHYFEYLLFYKHGIRRGLCMLFGDRNIMLQAVNNLQTTEKFY
jgi:hypothetical protein